MRYFFILLFLGTVLNREVAAEDTTYLLQGTVTDTSDNWLNGAQITLLPMRAKAKSNTNGEFELKFTSDTPLKLNKQNRLATLKVERSGHKLKIIPIKSMDTFTSATPIVVKLEPNPVKTVPGLYGFTTDMKVPKGRGESKAEFHVYIPESVERVKAAFYISRHGMGDITRPVLKKFAEEEQLALVGMYGDPVQRGVESVTVLDEPVKKLADMSGHPELPDAPIMTFGHSNGTGFAASFPRDRPDRVIAWVAFHPGFSNYLQFSNTEKVPAKVMCGTADKYLKNARQDQIVANMRSTRNAAMNVMMEGGVGHGPADRDATWEFITEFLKSAMRVRLGEDGKVKPVAIESGWLGGIYDFEQDGRQLLNVAPYADFKGDKSTANWFPDGVFAKVWQDYGQKPSQ